MAIRSTILSAALNAGATSLTLRDAVGLQAGYLLKIDNEYLQATSGYAFGALAVPVLRGQQGTADADHVRGVSVVYGPPWEFLGIDVPWFGGQFIGSGGADGDVLTRQLGTVDGTAWQSKGWHDVRDYGAVGDGVADDTAALQAALTAACATPRRGSLVLIPPGVYRTTAPLVVIEGGVWIYGLGETGATAWSPLGYAGPMILGDFEAVGSDDDVLRVAAPAGTPIFKARISNLRIGVVAGKAAPPNGLHMRICSECQVDHVHVNGACRAGFVIDGCTISQWNACNSTANTYGFEFVQDAGDYSVSLTLRDVNIYAVTDAMRFAGSIRNVAIRDSWIEDYQNAIHVEQQGNVYLAIVDLLLDNVMTTSVTKTDPRLVRIRASDGAVAACAVAGVTVRQCTNNSVTATSCIEYTKGTNAHTDSYMTALRVDDSQFYGTALTSVVSSDTGNSTAYFFGRVFSSQSYGAAETSVALTDGTVRRHSLLTEFGDWNMADSLPLRLPTAPMVSYAIEGLFAYNTVTNRCVITDGSALNTIPIMAAAQTDSVASDVAGLRADFNTLLGKLRTAKALDT